MKLNGVTTKLKNWFVARAVETVDSWDGAASNYADTTAYCKACLIDVNPSGKAKAQSHCMLPVKAPGSSMMADKAIIAAAGGHGLTQVKKPGDVDQATWDAAKKKAAKALVNGYKAMKKDAPTAIMDMAGVARAITVDSIFTQLQSSLYDNYDTWGGMGMGYLVTVYIDGGNLYALFSDDGLLKRSPLTLGDNDVVTLGPMEDVSQQFTPTTRSSVTVIRQADGNYRLFMLAGTAIINKDGQIDSTALFDDMIERAEQYDFWPTFDLHHLGEDDESFDFGQADWLGRDGVCYLASGVLFKDHPLTIPMVRQLQEHPEDWGASIAYYSLPDTVDYLELGELQIPVFTKGLNTRISILPTSDASAWFTSVELEKRAMNRKQEATLRKILGDEEFNKRMALVTGVNDTVDKQKLIFRAADGEDPKSTAQNDPPAAEQPPAELAPNVVNADLTPEIELDDQAIEAIATAVSESPGFAPMLTALMDKLNAFMADFGKLQTEFTAMQATVTRMGKAVEDLDQENTEHAEIVKADKPRRVNQQVRMTYRPRVERAALDEFEIEDSEAIANATLAKIPHNGAYPS